MNVERRVAFIVPYLGPWPRWAELFFISVSWNPMIEVLLLCETPPPFSLPDNVRCRPITREELLHRLNSVTGLGIRSISGHKLCDFRPFFGLAFGDLLGGFMYWGFCDIDMMFGDLSRLLARELDAGFDVFSAHDRQVVGHFAVLRNEEKTNQIGFGIPGWKELCAHPDNRAVDEIRLAAALKERRDLAWQRTETLESELEREFCRFGITFGFEGEVAYLPGAGSAQTVWHDGRVHYADEHRDAVECLYVHFMGLKRWWHWTQLRGNLSTRAEHRFSRVGYGGPRIASALAASPWLQIYKSQRALGQLKSRAGGLARRLLPAGAFRRLRRALLGRGRF